MRPDVLIVGDVASIHVRRLVTALHERNLDVELAGFEGDEIDGVPIHRLGRLPVSADPRYLLAVPKLARLIRRREPAVVNAHYLTSYGVMSALALRLAFPFASSPPLVQTTWGDDLLVTPLRSVVHQELARFALRSAALVAGDSRDLEVAARKIAPGLTWHRFIFGPPAALLTASADREAALLSARQLVPEMRVDLIVDAFRKASVKSALHGWKLVIAGTGPERDAIRERAGGMPNIEFVGMLPQEDLHRRMLRSCVAVSIPKSDATSATLLETLAARMVPIVNDLPANREWVDPPVGEVVSRDPSPEEVAQAMVRASSRTVEPADLAARVAGATWERQVADFALALRQVAVTGSGR